MRPPRVADPQNAEVRQLGAADPTLSAAALPVAELSGHGGDVAAVGVEGQPYHGGSVNMTIVVAAG